MFNPAAKYLPSLLFYSLILATATPVLCAAPNIAFEASKPAEGTGLYHAKHGGWLRSPQSRSIPGLLIGRQQPTCGSFQYQCHQGCCNRAFDCCPDSACCGISYRCHLTNIPGVYGCCPLGQICTRELTGDCSVPGTLPCVDNPNYCCVDGILLTTTRRSTTTSRIPTPTTTFTTSSRLTTFAESLPTPPPGFTYKSVDGDSPDLLYAGSSWQAVYSSCGGSSGGRQTKVERHAIRYSFKGRAIYLYASSYNAHWSVFYGEVRTTFGDANASVVGVAKNCTITWAAEGLDATVMTTITIEVYGPQIQSGVDDFMFEFNNLQVAVQEATMGPVSTTAGPTRSSPAAGVPTSPFASRAECIRCQNIAWALFVAAVALVVIS